MECSSKRGKVLSNIYHMFKKNPWKEIICADSQQRQKNGVSKRRRFNYVDRPVMTMRRWQITALSSLFLVFLFIVFLLFGRQLKQRFDDMQKMKRLNGYLGELQSVSESLLMLEKSERDLKQDLDMLKEVMQRGFNVSDDSTPLNTQWRLKNVTT